MHLMKTADNAFNESVNVKLNNSMTYSLKLADGFGILELENLTAGKYIATVSYKGDNTYRAEEAITEFTIREND